LPRKLIAKTGEKRMEEVVEVEEEEEEEEEMGEISPPTEGAPPAAESPASPAGIERISSHFLMMTLGVEVNAVVDETYAPLLVEEEEKEGAAITPPPCVFVDLASRDRSEVVDDVADE
jgi:hypothetical protein